MSDEVRKRHSSIGNVMGVLSLVAVIVVAILLYQLSSKVGELGRHREEHEHQQVAATVAEVIKALGIRAEQPVFTSQSATSSAQLPVRQDHPTRRIESRPVWPQHTVRPVEPRLTRPQRVVSSNDDYKFDPTYGMRHKSEIARLRPKRMETGEEYRRMHEECKRQARTSTAITDWDAFAKDINRRTPSAAEFSAIMRGDRSIFAVD